MGMYKYLFVFVLAAHDFPQCTANSFRSLNYLTSPCHLNANERVYKTQLYAYTTHVCMFANIRIFINLDYNVNFKCLQYNISGS